jgi:integrase
MFLPMTSVIHPEPSTHLVVKNYFSFRLRAKACKAAGLPGRLVHDFRRTAVRNLEGAGVSRSAAMKLTGHKTEAVYRHYAIVDSTMLREVVDKLGALHPAEANYPSSIRVSPVLTGK